MLSLHRAGLDAFGRPYQVRTVAVLGPHVHDTDGFFAAVMERAKDAPKKAAAPEDTVEPAA